ncbi:MAG: hypothetical protein ACJAR5_002811 [Pseudophaeobacter arcticus]
MRDNLATDAQVKAIERYYNTTKNFTMNMGQASRIIAIRGYVH